MARTKSQFAQNHPSPAVLRRQIEAQMCAISEDNNMMTATELQRRPVAPSQPARARAPPMRPLPAALARPTPARPTPASIRK
jgi:hypothetical protein